MSIGTKCASARVESLEPRSLLAGTQIVPLTAADIHADETFTPLQTTNASTSATTANTPSANVSSPFNAKINFQPSGSSTPAGYSADVGNTYGLRPNGQTYGWKSSNVGSHFDRNSSRSPDQRYDTGAKMSSSDVWEIKVPNGWYQVDAFVGDAWNHNADYRINVEGKLAVWVKLNYAEKYFGEGHIRVQVTDGKLTLSSASGARNNAIDYVHIAAASAPAGSAYKNDLQWKYNTLSTPIARVESAAVRVGDKMYFIGGYTNSFYTSVTTRMDIFNIKTKAWTRGPSVPGAQTHAGATTDGRYIYYVGGQYGASFARKGTNEAWRYDTQQVKWERFTNLPEVRFGGALAFEDHHLYFFGGTTSDRNTASSKAWRLDLNASTRKWESIANLPRAADHIGHAVLNGKVYALGGEHDHGNSYIQHDDVYAYNPDTGVWTQKADLPLASSHFESSIVVQNNKIWVFGGQVDAQLMTNQVRSYDPTTNSWTRHPNLPEMRKGGASWYDNGKFYYLTGDAYKKAQPKYVLEAKFV